MKIISKHQNAPRRGSYFETGVINNFSLKKPCFFSWRQSDLPLVSKYDALCIGFRLFLTIASHFLDKKLHEFFYPRVPY